MVQALARHQKGYEKALLKHFSLLRHKTRFFCDLPAVTHSSPPEETILMPCAQAVCAGIGSM